MRKAREEKYPDMTKVMRNVYRVCDSRAGADYKRAPDHRDYEMIVRACRQYGIGTNAFIAASEKTGLSVAKLYE
jgi:hypothetical protein